MKTEPASLVGERARRGGEAKSGARFHRLHCAPGVGHNSWDTTVRGSLVPVSDVPVSDDPMPDRSMEHLDKVAWMVETNGWALEPIAARPDLDPPRAAYAYTIGFEATYGFPEVLVFGQTPSNARGIVGLVVELLESGVQPPVGPLFLGLFDGEQRAALLPVDVDAYEYLFTSAAAFYGGKPFRVAQLMWPDRNGWMPWESGFEHRLALAEPIIGSLADID